MRLWRRGTAAFVPLLLVTASGHANFTWDGTGDGVSFTDDANWVGGMAPPLDLLDGNNNLTFGATGVAQSPDIAGDDYTNIDTISFTGADASFTITDSVGTGSFTFAEGGGILNDSALLQTIEVNLAATGDDFFIDAMAGDLDITGTIDLSDTGGVLMTITGGFDTTLSGVISGAGGALLKEGAGTLTLSGANSFSGGVELNEGTLVLGNDGALGSGNLVVSGDSDLQSDDDARAVSNDITIDDMVILTVSGDHDLRLNGTISGDGSLTMDFNADDDVLFLTRANDYTGGTTLMQGTVRVGHNEALSDGVVTVAGDSSIQSNSNQRSIANDFLIDLGVTLTFNGDRNMTMTGVITGDGMLAMDGTDIRLRLEGDNTYTGGTLLGPGTLVLGHDNALGTGDLTLTDDGAIRSSDDERVIANDIDTAGFDLTIDGANDLTLDGVISGAGGLVINPDDDVVVFLNGASTYTGLTSVDAGELVLDGSITAPIDVNDGARLSGTGSMMGNLTVNFGGTFAPGNSIGTFTVDGDFDLLDGGDLEVELSVDDMGVVESDLVDVTGDVTLEDGSTVTATLDANSYIASGTEFTIIQSGGTLVDNGSELVADSATVTVELMPDVDPNTYRIELFRASDAYSNAAVGGNNFAIGTGLDSLIPIADADTQGEAAGLLAQLDSFDAATYNQAVSELSPEPYNAQTAATLQNIRDYTTQQASYLSTVRLGLSLPAMPGPPPGSMALAADDPLLMAAAIAQAEQAPTQPLPPAGEESRWGRYIKVQGVFVDQDTDGNRTGFSSTAFGGQIGVDYNFTDSFVAGVALGYAYTDADLDRNLGNLNSHAVRVGPYMSYYTGNFYIDGSLTAAYHFYDGNRNLPTLGRTANSDYNGWDATAYIGSGYHFNVDWDLWVTPIGSLLYTHWDYDGFTETGGGGANLTVPGRTDDSLQSRLGAAISWRFPDVGVKPVPYFYTGWQHEFLTPNNIEARFATGGSPFTVNTGSRDRDSFFVGGGLNVLLKHNVSAFVRLEGNFGSTSDAVGFAAGLSSTF